MTLIITNPGFKVTGTLHGQMSQNVAFYIVHMQIIIHNLLSNMPLKCGPLVIAEFLFNTGNGYCILCDLSGSFLLMMP